ncbi:hypothetical protein [Microvirga tunisiensis]|uniref:Uncharacterized protein n=1 Tax=Microvirga tunisiensis TaxID=2108360 RepID=A0A5N7ML90_9HYPH|nr:hypothetical protein [Microvirga tunisiensis]MPR09537.1 hypothetical protein [Microvirga tunisiensis]MPR27757.1 hypothetical protein [Microvirga tunisiensis]
MTLQERLTKLASAARTHRASFAFAYSGIPGFPMHFIVGGNGAPLEIWLSRGGRGGTRKSNSNHLATIPVGPSERQAEELFRWFTTSPPAHDPLGRKIPSLPEGSP